MAAPGCLGPDLALGDEALQQEYQAALEALRDGRYDVAERQLFREDAFALIAPFLDLDYYAIAVLSIAE